MAQHFRYWIFPTMLILVCMGIYFLDPWGLSFLMAPEYNREFGFVEFSQLLLIVGIIHQAWLAYQAAKDRLVRLFFIVITLLGVFIFLEEIDYGIHIYEWWTGNQFYEVTGQTYDNQIRNLHNQGRLTHFIKLAVYLGFLAFLGILPWLKDKWNALPHVFKPFIPSTYFTFSLIAMLGLNQLALWMDKSVKAATITALDYNVSEFEEIFIYYIAWLYVRELRQQIVTG